MGFQVWIMVIMAVATCFIGSLSCRNSTKAHNCRNPDGTSAA